jgi:hypothetical protein
MIVNSTVVNNSSNKVLSFDEKVDLVKRCIFNTPDGWNLLVKSMKNSGVGSARVQCLAILRKIAKDKGTSNTETQEIFSELVTTLDKHLAEI